MKRTSILKLGLLIALAPACGDDTTSPSDTENGDSSSDSTASETMPTTITTTSPTTDTTGDTDPSTSSSTTGVDTGDTETDTDTTGDVTDTDTDTDTTGNTDPVCGDGMVEGDEECDGDALGDAMCPVFGDVACNDDCTVDMSACTNTLSLCNTPAAAIDDTITTIDAPLVDTISVTDDFYVIDVNVPVDITHTYIADVHATLISPEAGLSSVLLDRNRCTGGPDDAVATFDDDGSDPACGVPAFDGDVTPATPLADMIGISSMGDWQLEIYDGGFGDNGTLNEWCVELTLSAADPVMCGDGMVQFGEACDSDDLAGSTCTDVKGFIDGDLGCADDCTFDTSACIAAGCGNGILEAGEDCDGTDLGDATCGDLDGFATGTLGCADDCTFDTTACVAPMCGDGVLSAGEDCDGTELGGASCDGIAGYVGGTLGCAGDCTFDVAGCTAAPVGDWCGAPFVVDPNALPYTDVGDTLAFSNDYGFGTGVCPGESGSGNAGSEDVVYALTPTTTATYTIQFDATYDSTVYAVTDCGDINNSCVAGSDNGNPETLVTELIAGTTYYIIGGHWSNSTPGLGGAYTLTISDACFPSCDGVTCGNDDGCGGECGCDGGDICFADTCQAPPAAGDTCDAPRIIDPGALPYTDTDNTLLFGNDYGYSVGACPGEPILAGNNGSPDVVYAFTPDADGDYRFDFDAGYDSVLYMVTDCADIDTSCVFASDNGNPESITETLTAGTTYYIVGGAYSNTSPGTGGDFTFTATAL